MNKLLKTITIVTMLLLTIFTAGCESQQEKFDKAEQKLINRNQVTINIVATVPNTDAGMQKMIDAYRVAIKDVDPMITELEKIAKGNKELEEKAQKIRNKFERDKKELPNLIKDLQRKGAQVH